MEKIDTHLLLFFTWDVSLYIWKDKGLFEREIRYYQELAARGVKVTFVTWGDKKDLEIAKGMNGIDVVPLYTRLPCPHNKALRAMVSLLAAFKLSKEVKQADILKTNQMWGAWVPVLAKLIYCKPLIVRTGFELYKFSRHEKHNWLRQQFIRVLSWVSYKAADLIYVASAHDRDFVIKEFSVRSDRIFLRPNWIDGNAFSPREGEQKHSHILYVGRLSKQKNLFVLIDALSGLDYTLDIIGDGELKAKLRDFARQLGVRVNFLGAKPNDRLPEIFSAYPLYVLPSKFEGNPKTLLEAMACGCAVMGADVEGVRGLIRHNENGFLVRPDALGLKDGILQLMQDDALRVRLGKEARKTVLAVNDIESLIQREIEDYTKLAEHGNG